MPYPRLFSPLRIGPHQARNRIVLGAHFTMSTEPARRWGEPGFFGRRLERYLAERAQGGAGVVIRTHGEPRDDLYFELARVGLEVVRVGDSVAARTVDRAIFDGQMAVRNL